MNKKLSAAIAAVTLGGLAPFASGATIQTFTTSAPGRDAKAIFAIDDAGNLTLTLQNTASAATSQNSNLLTAVYFDVSTNLTLSTLAWTAEVAGPSSILGWAGATNNQKTDTSKVKGSAFDGAEDGVNLVGGTSYIDAEWFFATAADGFGPTTDVTAPKYGLGTAGDAGFGSGQALGTYDLFKPILGPDGLDYAIASDLGFTGNSDAKPVVKGEIVFRYAGFGTGAVFSNVRFNWGTTFSNTPGTELPPDEPGPPDLVPVPGAASAGLMLLGGLGLRRRRRLAQD